MIFSTVFLSAQEVYKDRVSLKNGSIFYGQLLDYNVGGDVDLKIASGKVLTFSDSLVAKIEINATASMKIKDYKFKPKGNYSMVGFRIIPGIGELSNISNNGLGLDFSFGYRYSELFSIGVGLGVHTYNYGFGEFFFPLYIDMMSFLKKNVVSPFIKLQIGYSALNTTAENVIDSNGGILINPAFGVRFTGNESVNYSFDLNYIYQKANFAFRRTNWNQAISYRDIIFRRFSLRFGVLF